MVIRTGEEKDPHWVDSAETWISAILAAVAYFGEPGDRSLADRANAPQQSRQAGRHHRLHARVAAGLVGNAGADGQSTDAV